jgi:2-methylaconitate cis-trans-isomerase PrpF
MSFLSQLKVYTPSGIIVINKQNISIRSRSTTTTTMRVSVLAVAIVAVVTALAVTAAAATPAHSKMRVYVRIGHFGDGVIIPRAEGGGSEKEDLAQMWREARRA